MTIDYCCFSFENPSSNLMLKIHVKDYENADSACPFTSLYTIQIFVENKLCNYNSYWSTVLCIQQSTCRKILKVLMSQEILLLQAAFHVQNMILHTCM